MTVFEPALRRKVRAIATASLGGQAPEAVAAVEHHFGRMLERAVPHLFESGDSTAPHLTLMIPTFFEPDDDRPPLLSFVRWTIHGSKGHVVLDWEDDVRGNPGDLTRLRDRIDSQMNWKPVLLPSEARQLTAQLPDPGDIGRMLRGPVGDRRRPSTAQFSLYRPFGLAAHMKALASGGRQPWRAPVRGRLSLRPGPDDLPDHVTLRFRRVGTGQDPGAVATANAILPPTALRLLASEARTLLATQRMGVSPPSAARSVQPGEVIAEIPVDAPFWMVESACEAAEFELMELFHQTVRPLLVDAVRGFRAALDAAALRAMKPFGLADIAVYNWLTAGGDTALSVRRRQALEVWPAVMAASGDLLSPVVDTEARLAEEGAALIGTSPAVLRATRGVTLTALEAAQRALPPLPEGLYPPRIADEFAESMGVAAGLDPRLLPSPGKPVSCETQWVALGRQRLAHTRVDSFPELMRVPTHRAAAIAGYRRAQLSRDPPLWQSETGLRRIANLLDSVAGGEGVLRSFHRHVLAAPLAAAVVREPLLVRLVADGDLLRGPDGASLAGERLAGGGDITRLAALCDGFADIMPALSDMLAVAGAGGIAVHWPPLTPPFSITVNGEPLTVTPLVTAGALVTEGRAMRHCVGTYVRGCLVGNRHIVSVRAPAGRLSTVELQLEEGLPQVVQHRGARNGVPPRPAQVAIAAWLDAIAAGTLAFDAAALEAARAERMQRDAPRLESELGFDPSDTALCDALFDLFRPLLPDADRGLTRADYLDRHGVTLTLATRLLALLETPNAHDEFGETTSGWNRAHTAVVRLFERTGWPLPGFGGPRRGR